MTERSGRDERIKAIDFAAPGSAPTPDSTVTTSSTQTHTQSISTAAPVLQPKAPWWHSQFNLMLCVFALLTLTACLFVLLAPSPTEPNQLSTVVATDGSASQAEATRPSSENESAASSQAAPWDESRRAQARSDSQDILSSLLEAKKALESKKVLEWAPKRFQAALDEATTGDEFYKQQDYAQAIAAYTAAAEQMEGLSELIPEVLKSKVRLGRQALTEGKAALAAERFKEALALDLNDIGALTGLDRAQVLDDVLALVSSALTDEQAFLTSDEPADLNSAKEKYQQAIALDKMASQAIDGLSRVQKNANDKEFRSAMTDGYQSLFARRYSSARKAFSKALKIKPSDATANAAYRQSLASDKSSSLSSLLVAAKNYEKSEQWASALSNYQTVLQRDANQVDAKLGEIRSRVRSQLDERLTASLADPLALSRATQKQRVQKLLSDARGINDKGPRLKEQIADIELAIQQLDLTVNVTLSSDQLTDVTLVKKGSKPLRLGKFSNRKLALKPGRYVLSGQRVGYKDVREELELGSQLDIAAARSIDVRCSLPVAATSDKVVVSDK